MEAWLPRWAPDGKRVAFMGRQPGGPWKICLVGSDGGTAEQLTSDLRNEADPAWSHDGAAIVFGRLPDYKSEPAIPKALFRVDVKTRAVRTAGTLRLSRSTSRSC
jgi:Tol biopolymer transport system component